MSAREIRPALLRGTETLAAEPFSRAGSQPAQLHPPAITDVPAPQPDPALQQARTEIGELQAEIARMRRDHEAALRDTAASARQEALASVQRDETARIELLKKALANAADLLRAHLSNMESHALRVAKAALEPVFGPGVDPSGLVLPMVRHQVQGLRDRSIVRLRYSGRDGLAAADVEAALAAAGAMDAVALADPALPPGQVRIEMRLGQVVLDLPDHGRAVQALLAELAGEKPSDPGPAKVSP